MMKLSVLLLLALCTDSVLLLDPGLGGRVPNITAKRSTNQTLPTPVAIKNSLDQYSLDSLDINQTNLEWRVFNRSAPNGAISIFNKYVGRIDYVCQFWCNAGFYSSNVDPYCHYSLGGKEYTSFLWPFEILVNKDNFEFMEWKDGSYGSVPPNSIKTCSKEVYVGMNEYGLGKVDVNDKVFYLPWEGSEYWYRYYQVLTLNKDINSEHLSEVQYKTDGVKPIEYPPETMRKSAITNYQCQTVTGTATLSKTYQVEQRWDTSFSITMGIDTSITAGIPIIGSAGIGFSEETTLEFTKGTTYIESTTHTVTVECKVPPNMSCGISMVGFKYGAEIPYTARLSRTYSNGKTTWTSISGTYKGVQMGEILAVMDRCEPVPDPTPCP
ncbi:natterin-3-like [Pseudoliparis swirei]|uniref:natterin-3-like n=1 Tax=Pseudoliparis swirei TaxID=2059687 RepID=UPI0024BD97C9|nr:natterin-3-like [Pseudoliparis swirei]